MTAANPLFPQTAMVADGTPVQRRVLNGYLLDFHKGSDAAGEILFVTFENRASARTDENRLPWGFSFLRDEGCAVLGVKAKRVDWYRDAELADFFASADFLAFTGTFRRVIFYGGSMGGTGALALATLGATVLAISPQVTLDPALTPWETRYDEGRAFDWSGDYQAINGAARAAVVYALYDPFDPLDPRHIALLPSTTLCRLKLPFMGHGVPDWVTHTDLLKDLVRLVASESLTPAAWNALARRRRLTPDYGYRMGALRRTPCVQRLCTIDALRCWCRMADQDPTNLQLQMHVMKLLMENEQLQAAQAIGQRMQDLLDAVKQLDK